MGSKVTSRSTGGAGFAFEDLVAADLLSLCLADRPLPGIKAPVFRVQMQVRALGWTIDDILCTASKGWDGERRLAISCKSNVQVSGRGLPPDFVSSAWERWRNPSVFDRS